MTTQQSIGIVAFSGLFGIGIMLIVASAKGIMLGLGAGILAALIVGLSVEWFYR